MQTIFFLITFLIVYGSLYPFEFVDNSISFETLVSLFNNHDSSSSRGDVLGNIFLFIPYGFVGMLYFIRTKPKSVALVLLTLLAGVLAVACQIAQLAIPVRSPALIDVAWNAVGFFIGVFASGIKPLRLVFEQKYQTQLISIPVILLGLWMISNLIPFVPTIDLQAYKDALKPLLQTANWVWYEIWLKTGGWLACAHFGKALMRQKWHNFFLIIGILLIFLLQIIIVNRSLSVNDVSAGLLAFFLWSLVIGRLPTRALLIAGILFFGLIFNGLAPFSFNDSATAFSWIPFSGYLTGSMMSNATALTQKMFLFGAILWLLKESGWKMKIATLLLAFSVIVIEIMQIWLTGRSAEITDVIFVILIGIIFSPIQASVDDKNIAEFVKPPSKRKVIFQQQLSKVENAATPSLIFLAMTGLLMMVGSLYFLLKLPNIPYNVRELFNHGGSLFDLLFFCLAIVSFGASAVWIGRISAYTQQPYIDIPKAFVAATVLTYFLLWMGVTHESISDIVGSSVIVDRIVDRAVLGQIGIDFVNWVGAEKLKIITDIVEPIIRFGALSGPLSLSLAFFYAMFFNRKAVKNGLIFLIGFVVCKVITFDWSSTDNLNELIDRDGAFGLGGGGYLYTLVLLISGCAASLAWTFVYKKTIGSMTAIIIISVPIGWWLLNAGLIKDFTKYDVTYSGVDFLLGPDRRNHLSEIELFGRWLFVQIAGTLMLAFGGMLYLRWQSNIKQERVSQPILDLDVQLDSQQLNFIAELGEKLNQTLSEVVNLMINHIQHQVEENQNLYQVIKSRLQGPPSTKRIGRQLSRKQLTLEDAQQQFVSNLSKENRSSQSRVVRLLVDQFIEDCSG